MNLTNCGQGLFIQDFGRAIKGLGFQSPKICGVACWRISPKAPSLAILFRLVVVSLGIQRFRPRCGDCGLPGSTVYVAQWDTCNSAASATRDLTTVACQRYVSTDDKSWDRPPLPTSGDDKEDATYAAVGRVLSQWENIEGELSHIFALCIGKMWTNEAYDQYYAEGKTTKSRLCTVEETARQYFISSPNQEAEGCLRRLIEGARGFADRRHEVAHGIVRPINWYWSLLKPTHFEPDTSNPVCLVPPHYFSAIGLMTERQRVYLHVARIRRNHS